MLHDLNAPVSVWLHSNGQSLFKESTPPLEVKVKPRQTVLLATLVFRSGVRRVVVKQYLPSSGAGAEELYVLHQFVRSRSRQLARALPCFLACSGKHNFVVMEHVPGPTLLGRITRGMGLWSANSTPQLYQTGQLVAEAHTIRAADLGAVIPTRKNKTYLQDFEEICGSCEAMRSSVRGGTHPSQILDHLSSAFFEREGDRLYIVDMQPKNILVTPGGDLCLIDLCYSWANPALMVGYFLASLDRVSVRLPWLPKGRIRAWKQAFLAGYCDRAPALVPEDLIFFYPWILLRMWRDHVYIRPWFGRYLRRRYDGCIQEFIAGLKGVSRLEIAHSPAVLFGDR